MPTMTKAEIRDRVRMEVAPFVDPNRPAAVAGATSVEDDINTDLARGGPFLQTIKRVVYADAIVMTEGR